MRLRVPDEGETVIHDQIRGDIATPNSAIKDFVIRRSDGSALYNLAVAVDDRDMGITQVIRGEDHISNTPRQVMILRALGAEPPPTRISRCCTGPTARSSRSATAPRRFRSCATPATCPRRCATTCRCSAGAMTSRRPS